MRRQRVARGSLAPVQGPRARRGRRRRDPRGVVGRARHGRRLPPARPPRQEPRRASPPAAGQGARRGTPSRSALERLAADGFLDDAAFARSYVADKRRLGGWGARAHPPRPARARRGRGDRRRRRSAPARRGGDDDELDRALAVLRRRGAPEQPLEAARRRAFQALLRRGFSSSVAYAAVRRWTEEAAAARIDSARRRHVLSKHATCARALCIPLSLLHSDTDGARRR